MKSIEKVLVTFAIPDMYKHNILDSKLSVFYRQSLIDVRMQESNLISARNPSSKEGFVRKSKPGI